ncbi:hypothetical protein PHYPSEUDO_014121 [Phytophthora pseudosyringae]|uniref:FYVE-type domain-containing protein n=1 Tax=Phytophthora pseudosyringae TaxID=221518 RepID=A0A8T1W5Q0_9STRA|nr:hypothetical protein PHYPSEUDO_014121 [Phytophthora pseudosyringae]
MTQGDVRASPFQPLSLAPSDTNQLQLVVETILDANLGRYQRFLDSDNGNVSPRTWKLVKTVHRTRVYLERQHRPALTPFQGSLAGNGSNNAGLQPMLCVGSTFGRLDDVMLGIVNPPPSCVNDLSRAPLLSTLRLPTPATPFQSVEVKWMELNVRSKAMGLVKNHDYVYVEATGTLCLANGERIGYHLLHSIDIPAAHRLPRCARAQLSVCSFFRQETTSSVSVYVLGMMDPMNDRVRRVVLPHFVNTLLSTFKRAPSVNTKRLSETPDKRGPELKNCGSFRRDGKCITCSKRAWRLGKTATCNVCSGHVCSSCKVVEELSFMTLELEMTQRKVVFCSSCAINESVSEFSFAQTASYSSSRSLAQESEVSVLSC